MKTLLAVKAALSGNLWRVSIPRSHRSASLRYPRFWLILLCISLFTQVTAASDHPASEQLVLLNWSEYMDPDLLRKFEALHGIEVKEVYFANDDTRDSMVALSNATGYELILVNGLMLETYQRRGWLAEIPHPEPANLSHVDNQWRQAFPSGSTHAVPILWGSLGIAYRRDLIPTPDHSWAAIFEPDPITKGRIGMIASVRDLTGVALKSLGYSLNTTNRQELAEAAQLLERQKPQVDSYLYSALNKDAPLVTGRQVMSLMYNGDALYLQQFNDNIEYFSPREGSGEYIDYLVVTRSSTRSALAWKFIDFLCEPENAAQLAAHLSTATTNIAAIEYLPSSYKLNKTINPGANTNGFSERYKPLSPRALNRINSMVINIVGRDSGL